MYVNRYVGEFFKMTVKCKAYTCTFDKYKS